MHSTTAANDVTPSAPVDPEEEASAEAVEVVVHRLQSIVSLSGLGNVSIPTRRQDSRLRLRRAVPLAPIYERSRDPENSEAPEESDSLQWDIPVRPARRLSPPVEEPEPAMVDTWRPDFSINHTRAFLTGVRFALHNIHNNQGCELKALRQLSKLCIYQDLPESEETTDDCIICAEAFEPLCIVRLFQCQHAFHVDCIDVWLETKRTCPMCRRRVELNNE